jgi:hypothetical protein
MNQNKSLKYYQGVGYGKINSFLRDPSFKEQLLVEHDNDSTVQHINSIDNRMKNNDLSDIRFFRGIQGSFIPRSIESSSGVIVNTAYTSTTSDEKVIEAYTDAGGCCVLVFVIPKGLKTYVYNYQGRYSEAEVLVQRNTQFKIIKQLSETHYLAELYPYEPPKQAKQEKLEKQRANQLLEINFSDTDITDSDED